MTTTGITTPIAAFAPVERPLELEDEAALVDAAGLVADAEDEVVDPLSVLEPLPTPTAADVLLAIVELEVAVSDRSLACHLICTLYALIPPLVSVSLVVVVLVPCASVTTAVNGPCEIKVSHRKLHP